jgi:hypoxia-inducible factor (prolyl hydroxylase)
MEVAVPWAPTALHARLPAVRAYREGEQLCDEGRTAEGISRLREASWLAWELDFEWPGWALVLYQQLADGKLPVGPTPPALWAAASSAANDADAFKSLRARNFAVIDNFLGDAACDAVHAALAAAWEEGLLTPARVATPGNGLNGQRSDRTRSDHIAWAEPSDAPWAALRALVARADALVRELRRSGATAADADDGAGDGRADVAAAAQDDAQLELCRMRPMVARYGEGAAFARHCDNHCVEGRGPHCNGRWLTLVYYCNRAWREGDGGCLRLYAPQGDAADGAADDGAAANFESGDALCDVAPTADRAIVFYSDFRVPHEVRPAAQPRYATTLWYTERSARRVQRRGRGTEWGDLAKL